MGHDIKRVNSHVIGTPNPQTKKMNADLKCIFDINPESKLIHYAIDSLKNKSPELEKGGCSNFSTAASVKFQIPENPESQVDNIYKMET